MAANDKQEGGAHYKGVPVEHWDFVLMHNIPYLEAQIIKYVMRHKKKNGIEDLRKARHFLEKLMEYELDNVEVKAGDVPGLEDAREALDNQDAMNRYMNPDSGEPQGKGYVDQD